MTHQRLSAVLHQAGSQHGLVTNMQLRALNISRSAVSRLATTGVLEPIGGPGVWRVAGGEPTHHQQLLAAVMAGGPHAVASHRAAAWLWRLDGCPWRAPELSIPRTSRRRPTGAILHYSTDLTRALVTRVDAIPVTEPTRTLIDLAATIDPDGLETAFDSALRQGLTSPNRARTVLERLARSGRDGIGGFRSMLDARDDVDGVTESAFEVRLVQVLRRAGLPEPVRQVELFDAAGLIGRFDCAYPAAMVAIEADSVRHHTDRRRFEEDRRRRTRAEAIGWRVPTFTWAQLTHRPHWVAQATAAILDAAGWEWRSAA